MVDRFAQIEPTVLLAVDGYRYGGRDFSRLAEVRALQEALPSLRRTVVLRHLDPAADLSSLADTVRWEDFEQPGAELTFEPVPSEHPLWVVYSSGTTGLPKPIVHGAGGVLVDHLKTHAFHLDVGPGDRMFFFCTTGWIAWNWLISALAVGSGIVLFDGNPMYPDSSWPWRLAAETATTFYASSPGLMMAARRDGVARR